MLLNRNDKKSVAQKAVISWLVVVAVCVTQTAFGGGGSSSIMMSQGPCLYSLQLQNSVSVRKSYLVKLSALLGGPLTNGGPVDEMYGDIREASYNGDAASANEDLLGFGSKARPEAAVLDSFSNDCMSCHDGAGAVSVAVDWRNNPAGLNSLRQPHGTDHPIGMDYQSYVSSRRDYKPVSGNKMLFVNGRVGCLTCHDPLNPERGHLVMSDRKSALCLTCHRK